MATETPANIPEDVPKVVIYFRATGDALSLRQDRFRLSGNAKFARVINYLRGQLCKDTMFVYINSAFSPNPDELLSDLYNNFGIDGQLVVNYAYTMAWG